MTTTRRVSPCLPPEEDLLPVSAKRYPRRGEPGRLLGFTSLLAIVLLGSLSGAPGHEPPAPSPDMLSSAQTARVALPDPPASPPRVVGSGRASYYSARLVGTPTASGEPYRPGKLTAAHRTLPLGTLVRVVNLRSGKSTVVRINDRGPFVVRRIIDVSHAAARELGMLESGTALVRVERIAKR